MRSLHSCLRGAQFRPLELLAAGREKHSKRSKHRPSCRTTRRLAAPNRDSNAKSRRKDRLAREAFARLAALSFEFDWRHSLYYHTASAQVIYTFDSTHFTNEIALYDYFSFPMNFLFVIKFYFGF